MKLRVPIDKVKLVIKKEEKFLGKLSRFMPTTTRVIRLFKSGSKVFIADCKQYYSIVRLLNTPGQLNNFQSLSLRQIELYFKMPKDLYRLLPVLVISMLPVIGYLSFLIAYLWPRRLLSSHFWTPEQRTEFSADELKTRIVNNELIFRSFQSDLDRLQKHKLYQKWSQVLGPMGSGFHPNIELILDCKQMFMCPPYDLRYLKEKHLVYLLKIHDLHRGMLRRERLAEKAKILKEMDKAIVREGGVYSLSLEMLRNACFIRGLCTDDVKRADMIRWLSKWITISSAVDKNSLSLLLHCPVLLGYTEGTNWHLIYSKKAKKAKRNGKSRKTCS